MIKMNVFLTRRADLTREEFNEYWTNIHTPLLAAMPANAENARKYVQLHSTGEQIPGLPSASYDGIAEIWVDDLAGAKALFVNDYYDTVIAVDEANFLDRSKTVFLYSSEDVIFG
ncbi:uncharacterized protein (TIGR02118 family) [Arthrobacter sp. GAS37]|uniref:EthD domain-containing protein n=1 Tax=Arthrobacter sp. GAS37 TaxID=3156261 RepID=UPI0038328A20